ncbi:MAG: leucine-rich repeat protein [Oscillospiraceae bacterium]|nr:leucine-rich repeat protein [Oscillospiraceae bacterium]
MKKIIALALCLGIILTGQVSAFASFRCIDHDDLYINPVYSDVITEEHFSHEEIYPAMPLSDADYYTDIEEAAKVLTGELISRTEVINIPFICSADEISTIANIIFDEAVEHSGNPVAGDYIIGQLGGWKAQVSGYQLGSNCYVTICYHTIQYYTDFEQEKKVDEAIRKTLDSFNLEGKSDYAKIKIIYDYICDNVTYDYKNLNNQDHKTKYTAYGALIDKTAVCQGYAMLLYRFALEEGIDARFITGVQTSTNGAHGWNIVELNGKYYNLDSTWDAGRTSYSYFLKCEKDFSNHTRDKEFETAEFNSEYPMSDKCFNPKTDDVFSASGFCGANGGKNLTWNLDENGVLTISGGGEMEDYSMNNSTSGTVSSSAPWWKYNNRITSVVLEDGITYIGKAAFCGLSNISGTVNLPSSLNKIAPNAFYGAKVQGITVSEGNDNFCAEGGILFTKNKAELLFYPNILSENYSVPEGTRKIGSYAFGMSSAKEIVLPESVESIDNNAFAGYNGKVEINSALKYIGSRAFAPFGGNVEVYFIAGEPYECEDDSFCTENGTIKLWYLSGTAHKWSFDDNNLWNGFELNEFVPEGHEYDEVVIEAGTCGDNLSWKLTYDGTLVIEGTGEMHFDGNSGSDSNFDITDGNTADNANGDAIAPWHELRESIKNLVLEEGVTSIADYAFSDCVNMTGTVELPEGVSEIGKGAFKNCSSLEEKITFPESLEAIGGEAFSGCGIDEFYFEGDAPKVDSGAESPFDSDATIHFPEDNASWKLDENGCWNGLIAEGYEVITVIFGDLDGNGKINVIDANLLRRSAAKLITIDSEQAKAGDVDGNGKINVIDANLIRRFAAKLITDFPVAI